MKIQKGVIYLLYQIKFLCICLEKKNEQNWMSLKEEKGALGEEECEDEQ